MEAGPAQTGPTPLDTPCHACAPRASPGPGPQLFSGPLLGPQTRPASWGLEGAPRGHPARAEANGRPSGSWDRAGTRPQGPCLPRTAACEHMRTGWPGQGAWASGQGVSHITSPLSRGTCWVLPSSSGWHGQGCQRTPFMPGVPHRPPQPYPHPPPVIISGQRVRAEAGRGQMTESPLHLQGIQEATGSGGAWLGWIGKSV